MMAERFFSPVISPKTDGGCMNNNIDISLMPHSQFRRIGPAWFLRLLLVLLVGLSETNVNAQTQNCVEPQEAPHLLNSGALLSRNISRNQQHVFRLALRAKEFARVTVDQKGADVVVRLLDSNRLLLVDRDNPNGNFGPEGVSIATPIEQTYYIEVCANRSQPAASYDLRVEISREATTADESRVAAERILMEGRRLAALGTTESRNLAIEQFNKAVEIWRTINDAREEGYALCNIGEQYRLSRRFADAMQYLNLALVRLGDVQDLSGQAYIFNQIGAAHRDLEKPLNALPNYDRALELRSRTGDRWGQAQIHNNIGVLYSNVGEQQASIANYQLALPIWRQVNDRGMELNTLNNIGKANLDLSNLTLAFQQLQTVLDSCGENNEPCFLEPFARNSLGMIHDSWGEHNEALHQYDRALKLFRERKNKKDEALVLDNTGMVFAAIGDTATAIDYFQEALKIRQNVLTHFGEEITRSNLGYAYVLMGNYAEALNQLRQAQQFSHTSQNRRLEAYTLMRIGMVYVALPELDKALNSYSQALEIQTQIEDVRGQAITLDKIGELYSLMAQPALALASYQRTLQRWASIGDRQGEALSLYGIARVELNQNKLLEARDKIVKAIERVESLRTRMTNHQLRLIYSAARHDYYELEIDIRMRIYDATRSKTELELALFASERARARNLLDFLTESRADIRQGVDPQLLALERLQRGQLADRLAQLQALLSKKHRDEDRITAERELQTLRRAFDETQAEIRRRSPRYASLSQPQPLRLSEIQRLLDHDTVLLEYALGEERSYLWLVTPTDVLPFTLPAQAQIEQAVDAFRESLTAQEPRTPNEDRLKYIARLRRASAEYSQHALKLSRMVLGPALPAIENKRLVIIADGALQYVPFAALPTTNSDTVIAKHEIIYQPSASALSLIRTASRPPSTKTLAVFADPVFDINDQRLRNASREPKKDAPVTSREFTWALRDAGDIGSADGSFRLSRLQYSREEANAIVSNAPPGSFMKATDFDASRANFLSQDLKQFRVVHLATHGILNARHPELSGLVFSLVDKRGMPQDGFLRVGDVYNLNLPIDMVVLSACRTGVGKLVRGEGLIGLTRGFMHAGAARVVASLWKVDDEATAELMKRFYANMLQRKMPAAAALRHAQLELIETRRSPYYWAGFILQGEWK
jgi:CHAT domain-containing protein/tetratricopeptide (TPR) repeat protein